MSKILKFTPKTITKLLLCIVGVLLVGNLAYIVSLFVYKIPRGLKIGPFFYFNGEGNFPALYSSLAILLAAILLWKIGNLSIEKTNKQSFYWKLLSGIFVFLALDEFFVIHELLAEPTRRYVAISAPQGSFLYFAWFIPYGLLFGLTGLFLLRFFLRLPYQTKILFAIAGLIFVSGSVGMEMVGGKYWSLQSSLDKSFDNDLTYALLGTVEELLEMLGIILFIHGLITYYLDHLTHKYIQIQLQLSFQSDTLSTPADPSVKKPLTAYQAKDKKQANQSK